MQSPSHSDPSLSSRAGTPSGLPQSTTPSFGLIDSELRQVKRLIDEQLSEAGEPVSRLLRSANIHGGKMIRPGLVLLSYHAVRDTSCPKRAENAEKSSQLRKSATSWDSTVSIKKCDTQCDAICVAAIVELIHNATLLHDDVIDGGQKRGGWPTVNSLCGNESAVLLGDFLLSKAFKISANLDPEIANIIADAAVRVCVGELRQITERRNWQLSESEYIDIITEKSAALFSSCCLLGGFLGGASGMQIRSLADFGLNVGIAFQITDDLLDIICDEGETGKTLGSDIDKNNLTLAVIHLLRAVDEREKSALINSYLIKPIKDSKTKNMMLRGELSNVLNHEVCLERDTAFKRESLAEMLVRLGSFDYAHSRAQEFVSKAIDALTELREGEAKDVLIETAKFFGQL
jgi:octaprenyl-diphosphate synthase